MLSVKMDSRRLPTFHFQHNYAQYCFPLAREYVFIPGMLLAGQEHVLDGQRGNFSGVHQPCHSDGKSKYILHVLAAYVQCTKLKA